MPMLPSGTDPILSRAATTAYSGGSDDYTQVDHRGILNLDAGTIGLSFTLDQTDGFFALISKDVRSRGEGEFTIWVDDGIIKLAFEEVDTTRWIEIDHVVLEAGTEYHLAFSFGPRGAQLWLNGALAAAEPLVELSLDSNTEALVIGGSRAWHEADNNPHSMVRGEIGNVHVFDRQLHETDMLALAEDAGATLDDTARAASILEDIAPVLGDAHHGSHTLRDILSDYGVTEHGDLTREVSVSVANGRDNVLRGTRGDDAIDAGRGNDVINGRGGRDILQGGYGNDTIFGKNGNDILDGGHGEDDLRGGRGNDLLISRSDGREGVIAQDPDYAPDQRIPANDILTGGGGADIFYFQTLINARREFLEEHTRDDGSINWHGVAGENENPHDHWVDHIGHDTIADFNRGQGDRIVIEGHTTEIYTITQGDANGDGVLDHSVITLYSQQGSNGGAHDEDQLGTITVFGDLVRMSDIEHTDSPAYGIVHSIDDLVEALSPADDGVSAGQSARSPAQARDLPALDGRVFSMTDRADLEGWDGAFIDVGHDAALELDNGTIGVAFTLDHTQGFFTLLSKDARNRNEADFSLYVDDGVVKLAFEHVDGTKWLEIDDLVLEAGVEYHVAFSFGSRGAQLWLNGELAAAEPEFDLGLSGNANALVIGGTRGWTSSMTNADALFRGTISDVHVFDRQLGEPAMLTLAESAGATLDDAARHRAAMEDLAPVLGDLHDATHTLEDLLQGYGAGDHGHLMRPLDLQQGNGQNNRLTGTDADDGINGGRGDDDIRGEAGADLLQGGYGNDTLAGGNGADILDGGHGEDVLSGGHGDDLLISRSDGREPVIAQDPDYAPDQRIPANDILTGGSGADVFYFQTLINARREFLEEHTRDDGSINWHGVAGENENPHDHWVDHIGHDTITDFNRAEGDRIVIEGHTTEIYDVSHGDANGDGVMDHSVITLYSQQGNNGGAHDEDQLGSITVFGDLVQMSDIEHSASPAYGIVYSIDDLAEALSPAVTGTSANAPMVPGALPDPNGFAQLDGAAPVFAVAGAYDYLPTNPAALIFDHDSDLALSEGTIAFEFNVTNLSDNNVLFSKDAKEYGDGGHLTGYVTAEGDLVVRVQSGDRSHYLTVQGAIEENRDYSFAYSFGEDGAHLYLNGMRMAYMQDLTQDLSANSEHLIIGAAGWSNTAGQTDRVGAYFDGTIEDFAIYATQMTGFNSSLEAPVLARLIGGASNDATKWLGQSGTADQIDGIALARNGAEDVGDVFDREAYLAAAGYYDDVIL